MKRSGAVKFPNSVQLFKFCQKVLMTQRGGKVHDQEVGSILNFNPSDCSHWKRGEKNVRSVFSLAKLAETLQIESGLVHDVASGAASLDEAFFEWQESNALRTVLGKIGTAGDDDVRGVRSRVESFVTVLHEQAEFAVPPLYIPEVIRFFAFVALQPTEMMDRLSRILRVKPGQYMLQYRKGDLKASTRMGMAKDLARIIFQGERSRFPELGAVAESLSAFEETLFVAALLVPKHLLVAELAKLDSRKNVVAELATLFWVPKALIGFQLQDIMRSGERPTTAVVAPRVGMSLEPVSA